MSKIISLYSEEISFFFEINELDKENYLNELWNNPEKEYYEKFKEIISLPFVSLIEFKKTKKVVKFLEENNIKTNIHKEWSEGIEIQNRLVVYDRPATYNKIYVIRIKYNNEYQYYKLSREDLSNLIDMFEMHTTYPKLLNQYGFPLLESSYSYQKNLIHRESESEYIGDQLIPLFSDLE
uniref:Uncharacterized protein n=1 Tax=viral metagenome TaxID=1070528 RepID=A0A6C0AFQ1_9ZZZZ